MSRFRVHTTIAVGLIAAFAAGPAYAGAADGVWKTEPGDGGGYLEVTMAPCASDAAKTCGTISAAYSKDGPDPNYANLGKLIVKNMSPEGGAKFSGGTIWDPEHNKTYDAHMTLEGGKLDVEGCVSIICSGQHWYKVK